MTNLTRHRPLNIDPSGYTERVSAIYKKIEQLETELRTELRHLQNYTWQLQGHIASLQINASKLSESHVSHIVAMLCDGQTFYCQGIRVIGVVPMEGGLCRIYYACAAGNNNNLCIQVLRNGTSPTLYSSGRQNQRCAALIPGTDLAVWESFG